jgi:hypothetical protein
MGQGGPTDGAVAQVPRPHRARGIVALLGLVGDVVVFTLASLLAWTVLPVIGLQAHPRVVADELMVPVVRAGDVLLTVAPADPGHGLLAPGAIVVTNGSDGELTRRIVRTDVDAYRVRGDAQPVEILETIPPEAVLGVGRFLVPGVGLPVHWVRTQRFGALIATIVVIGTAIALSGSARALVGRTGDATPSPTRLPQRVPGAQHPVVLATRRREATEVARRAALAARAAGRSAYALPTLEERLAAEREAARRARQEKGVGGGGAGGLLVLALAVVGVGLANPAFATLQAQTTDAGSHFSVAPAEPDAPDEPDTPDQPDEPALLTVFTLPSSDGAPSYTAGQQDETIVFPIHVDAPGTLHGPVRTALLLAPSTPGNPERVVEVVLLLDGVVIASDTQRFRTTDPQPTVRTGTLQGTLDGLVVAPGDRLELRITLRRVELLLDPGPSTITFAAPD